MTNPISPIAVSQLPPISEPLVNQSQYITVDWYQCILALFQRSGGTGGFDIATIQAEASQAAIQSAQALTDVLALQSQVDSIGTTANSAKATANSAETTAIQAQSNILLFNASACFKGQNLAGLTNVPLSRANIGVDTFPIILDIESATTGIKKCVPLWRPLTWPQNFIGSAGFAMVAPASTVVINISYIRSGLTNLLGTMTFFATGQIAFFSAQPEFTTETGDILTLIGPSDTALAHVGITFLTTLG